MPVMLLKEAKWYEKDVNLCNHLNSQNETACHIAWESYRWSWVGLQWLNNEELGRFLFYHCFPVGSRELWMRSYALTTLANHARCDNHCLPGTTNNCTFKPFVRTLFCGSQFFAIWGDFSVLTAPNWRTKPAHRGASPSEHCMPVLPFQLRFSAVKKYWATRPHTGKLFSDVKRVLELGKQELAAVLSEAKFASTAVWWDLKCSEGICSPLIRGSRPAHARNQSSVIEETPSGG